MNALLRSAWSRPAIVSLRRTLKDALWTVKGSGIQNPAIAPDSRSVLFVCLGNICRSPFAAKLAQRRLADAGLAGIEFSSAGIRPSQAARSPREAVQAARAFGVSLEHHVPQALTAELMRKFSLVVVMDAQQLAAVRRLYPEHRSRVVLLSLLDAADRGSYERYNIADPFGGPLTMFEECYQRIDRALSRILVAVVENTSTEAAPPPRSVPGASRSC